MISMEEPHVRWEKEPANQGDQHAWTETTPVTQTRGNDRRKTAWFAVYEIQKRLTVDFRVLAEAFNNRRNTFESRLLAVHQ